MSEASTTRRILITGGGGYIGTQLIGRLLRRPAESIFVVATDVREAPHPHNAPNVVYETLDVRDPQLVERLTHHNIDTVVHLASIVTPGKKHDRDFEYSVDVRGTENVLKCCVAAGVEHLIVTSSGAAYGYYADNPVPIPEDAPLRGNPEFTYSDNKRQIEERLAQYRRDHPELKQLIFRPGVVLGENTNNQITDLFRKRAMLGVRGYCAPWAFIWDEDVVGCIERGIDEQVEGIYNLVGDGTLSLKEVADVVGIPFRPLPAWMLKGGIWFLQKLGATQYGPEQVNFLRYRPVPSNEKLKREFGYQLCKTSRETLQFYIEHRREA